MKKIIALLLSLCFITVSFSGCGKAPQNDVWDSSVAEAFRAGNGSEANPYRIASAAQLAYLSESVSEGNTYAEAYFSLECDIDLNNKEWTPIGTKEFQFAGNFNGNGHTVSNLKMSDVKTYIAANSHGEYQVNVAGLFGVCKDASFCNLKLDGVDISIKNAYALENIYIGSLAAYLYVNGNSLVENIQVSNASFVRNSEIIESPPAGTHLNLFGGILGYISIDEDYAVCTVSKVQSDIFMGLNDKGFTHMTSAGGIIAGLSNSGTFECRNFAVYANAEFVNIKEYDPRIAYSAIAEVSNYGTIKLSNAYSELKINQEIAEFHPANPFGLSATAFIGRPSTHILGTCEFNNLFGCVKRADDVNAEPIYKLFVMSDSSVYTENNCQATDTLPESHGFDPEIWDLSDISRPKLK